MEAAEQHGESSPEETVRAAFGAFARNDRAAVERLIGSGFVWVFFDPFEEVPVLRTCSGRSQLTKRMKNHPAPGGWELVEIDAFGSRVAVTTSTFADRLRPRWREGDLNFHVVEVREGEIVALRACRDRDEAVRLAGSAGESITI
jgi:ketosteroid isomerase-like protein